MELGSRFGEPYVSIELNGDGARLFERITAENVGKRLAIVLDDTIYSAPAIREASGAGGRRLREASRMRKRRIAPSYSGLEPYRRRCA